MSAAACFTRSEAVFKEIGRDEERARTLRAWARHELARGDRSSGLMKWRQAREIFERPGVELEIQKMEHESPEIQV